MNTVTNGRRNRHNESKKRFSIFFSNILSDAGRQDFSSWRIEILKFQLQHNSHRKYNMPAIPNVTVNYQATYLSAAQITGKHSRSLVSVAVRSETWVLTG
jgi:hypothetical protein